MKRELIDKYDNASTLMIERITGSRLFGTSYELGEHPLDPLYVSDVDLRGVFSLDDNNVKIQFSPFNNYENIISPDHGDIEYLEIEKFFSRSIKGSPNNMDILFGTEETLSFSTDKGRFLLDNKHLFLSSNFISSSIGFSNAQFHRLNNQKKWLDEFPLINDVKMLLQLAFDNNDININFIKTYFSYNLAKEISLNSLSINNSSESFSIDDLNKKYLNNKIFSLNDYRKTDIRPFLHLKNVLGEKIVITDVIYDFLEKKARFSKKTDELYFIFDNGSGIFDNSTRLKTSTESGDSAIKYIMTIDYSTIKKFNSNIDEIWDIYLIKNKKRALIDDNFGYNVKRAMHSIRLLDTAIFAAENGSFSPKLSGVALSFAKELLSGNVSYDQMLTQYNNKLKKINSLKNKNALQKSVDLLKIKNIYNDILFK